MRSSAASDVYKRQVSGTPYTNKECQEKSLSLDPTDAMVWRRLGSVGGGTVSGALYTQKECLEKALKVDPTKAGAWRDLGVVGGGTVSGTPFTKKECSEKAVSLDPTYASAWTNLGYVGGGTVSGKSYTAADCFTRVRELSSTVVDAKCQAFYNGLTEASGPHIVEAAWKGSFESPASFARDCYLLWVGLAWQNQRVCTGGMHGPVSFGLKRDRFVAQTLRVRSHQSPRHGYQRP